MAYLLQRLTAFFSVILFLLSGSTFVLAQGEAPAANGVIGAGNYIRVVEDLDRTVTFYYELVGVEPRGGLIQRDFGVIEPVASMYNAVGGEFRSASFTVPNTTFVLEHLEWRDADRSHQSTDIQNPGTAALLLFVKDIDLAVASVLRNGGSIVTPSGEAISAGNNHFILVQDPDGYYIELLQLSTSELTSETNVLTGRFRLAVADANKSVEFYRSAMGFEYPEAGSYSDDAILNAINGTHDETRLVSAKVPGSALPVELLEYRGASDHALQQHLPRIGSSMLRIFVSDLDSVVSHCLAAGAVLADNNEHAVGMGNGTRFQIIEDIDGLLIQFVQRPL